MMSWVFIWLVVVMVVFGVTIVGLGYAGVISLRRSHRPDRQLPSSPENVLRDRYARGEIGRQAYLDALTDILKDRYVQGELTAEEYEERLGRLLLPPPARG